MAPALQFRTNGHGQRLAYARFGHGPPLVVPPGWISNVQVQFQEPAFADFYAALAERFTVLLYDRRGTGSSDRDRTDFGLESDLIDLEAIVAVLPGEPISFLGLSQGGPLALAWAARHTHRVRRLVLCGTFANGRGIATPEVQRSVVALVRAHWGMGARMLADFFIPGVDEHAPQALWFARLQREGSTAEIAARLLESTYDTDVRSLLPEVRAPALVIHRRGDRVVPAKLGRELAAGLPDARLALLEGNLHLPWMGRVEEIVELTERFLEADDTGSAEAPGAGARPRGVGREDRRYRIVHLDAQAATREALRPRSRVGLAQMDLPTDWLVPRGEGLVGLAAQHVDELADAVRRVVGEARRRRVDLLLMPEMAVDLEHSELERLLLELAASTEMLIVPGSFHHARRRANVCRVFGPSGVLWEQEKHIPAMIRLGDTRMAEGIRPAGERQVIVASTPLGRVAIVICRDFLDLDLRVELRHASPPVDIVLNPALTPVTQDFEAAHLESRRSVYAYCFFCNLASFGRSLVFSPEKGKGGRATGRKLAAGREGLLLKDIDLFGLREARRAWEEIREKETRFIQSTR